jgi:prepilin peptidase CpaA
MIHLVQAALAAPFPALVILAACKDITSYTIPNWISLALAAAFAPAALAMGLPLPAIGLHFGVGAAALAMGMAMFALSWIGGGDAKLFAAAALWLGWPAGASYGVFTAMAGGTLAMGLLSLRSSWLRPYVIAGPAWMTRLAEPDEAVPYGLAIAAGGLAAFPLSPFMKAFGGF